MSSTALAIRGARVLVGEALEPIEPAAILLSEDEIRDVGAEGEVRIPADAASFDASGLTVAPGFIDAHVHIGFFQPAEVLMGGVTTVRDLGWPPREIHRLAEKSRSKSFHGPEIVAAGPMLTAPGGYPTHAGWAPPNTGREVPDARHARGMVKQTIEEGAAIIKVALDPAAGPTFDLATLRAVVDAAHDLGVRVTAHVSGLAELEKALEAGIDELAHMLMSEERIPEAALTRMVRQEVVVVPTLSCRFGSDRKMAVENTRRFRAAGGMVVYGTDLGNEGPSPGIEPLEIGGMAEAGYPPLEIIRSATVDAARWLGLADRGVLEPGKRADIIAFAGATETPQELEKSTTVWRSGILRRSEELDG